MVRLREEGRSYEDIARVVGVGTSTVSRIVRHYEKTGSLEPLEADERTRMLLVMLREPKA